MSNVSNALRRYNQNKSRLSYVLIGMLLVALFAGGLIIGSAMAPSGQQSPSSADAANSGGEPEKASASKVSAPGGAMVNPPYLLKDFTLTNQDGQSMHLSDLRGRNVVLTFGYTNCTIECPATLANYKLLKGELGADADKATFLFVSVDGKRDTPDVLKKYLGQFDPAFIGMTGDEAALRALGQQYGLLFQIQTGTSGQERDHTGTEHDHGDLDHENYFVQHSSPSYFIDAQGYLRMVYFYGAAPDVMAKGLRQLINE